MNDNSFFFNLFNISHQKNKKSNDSNDVQIILLCDKKIIKNFQLILNIKILLCHTKNVSKTYYKLEVVFLEQLWTQNGKSTFVEVPFLDANYGCTVAKTLGVGYWKFNVVIIKIFWIPPWFLIVQFLFQNVFLFFFNTRCPFTFPSSPVHI